MGGAFRNYTDAETYARIIDYPNVTAMWTHSVATFPSNIAIIDGSPYTYRELDHEISTFRTVLKHSGVSPRDVVGVLCPNSIGFARAFLAAATYGAPAVLMPVHLDASTVSGIAQKVGMKAIVYDESLSEKTTVVQAAAPHVALIPSSATAILVGATPSIVVTSSVLAFIFCNMAGFAA